MGCELWVVRSWMAGKVITPRKKLAGGEKRGWRKTKTSDLAGSDVGCQGGGR